MATEIEHIPLTDADRRILAEISRRTGQSWTEVLHHALQQLSESVPSSADGQTGESLYDRLSRHGFIGCLAAGPEDLSTNPAYMEGFGENDR